MSASDGAFVWHECMAADPDGAQAFYCGVAQWGVQPAQMPELDYRMFTAGGMPVAGLMALPQEAREAGAPPHWLGYISVGDVDATAARVRALGGQVPVGPTEIPGVLRFAIVTDPDGAAFGVFKWTGEDTGEPPPPGLPGHIGWNELYVKDWQAVFPFYAELFGWTKGESFDMGPMGTYQLFNHGSRSIGGMMNRPPQMPASAWLYYFNTPDIDAAVSRVGAGGGKIVNGPMQVPGGDWIAQAIDPQGAFFALLGKRA